MPRQKAELLTEELQQPEAVEPEAAEHAAESNLIPVTSFAEVMRIQRELREQGMLPPDIELQPKKRPKTKVL